MSNQRMADRNLLFGVFALQMDFITRDQLMEGLQAWVLEKSKPLEDILADKGFLSASDCQLLLPLMNRHLEQHEGDAGQSLQSLSNVTPSVAVFSQVDDADLQQSLDCLQLQEPQHEGTPTVSFSMKSSLGNSRYVSLRPLAKGGLGEVFIARDTELDREVALKEIQGCHADDQHSRERFLIEAEITGKLEHPGIVPIYGLGTYEDGRPFYAMRFIQGNTLQRAIQEFHESIPGKSLDYECVAFRKLLGRFVDVCEAVGYAHSRGVLHRDLKPGNVMVGRHGETLVVDWGLAKVNGQTGGLSADEGTKLEISSGSGMGQTLPGSAIGTPGYMSPEQAEGKVSELGPATDVYGLGAILFTVLTGKRPIPGNDIIDIIRRTTQGEFPSPSQINGKVPKPLEAICLSAMALAPSERYRNCEELAEDVENYLAGEPVAAFPEPWFVRTRRWIRKHRTIATSLAVALSVALLGLLLGFTVVTGLNQELANQNEKLELANENERQQRERAEMQERMALIAKNEAERQSSLAQKRLDQANEVASELIFSVDRELADIPSVSGLRRQLHDRAQRLLESLLVEAGEDPDTLRLRGVQFVTRGDAALRYENVKEAETYYKESLKIARELAKAHPKEVLYQGDMSVSLSKLGDVSRTLGEFLNAQTHYEESLAISQGMSDALPGSIRVQEAIATDLQKLGDLAQLQNDLSTACSHYEKSLEIARKLAQADPPNLEAQRTLCIMLERRGNVAGAQGDLLTAETHYQEFLRISRNLLQSNVHSVQAQRDLVNSLNRMGNLSRAQNDLRAAQSYYQEALGIAGKLVQADPTNREAQRGLAMLLDNLGDVAGSKQDYVKAEDYYKESWEILYKLAKADPNNTQIHNDLLVVFVKRGSVAYEREKWEDAERAYRAGLFLIDGLTANGLGNADFKQKRVFLVEALQQVQAAKNASTTPAIAEKPVRD